MDPEAHLVALEREADDFSVSLEGGTEAPVPSCPGWTVGDLAVHLGVIHRWASETVRIRATEPVRGRKQFSIDPTDPEIASWFRAGATELVEVLAVCPPHQPVWSWVPDKTAAFWRRRQALETAVHRWDLEDAFGQARPIDPPLASDGIDEWLDVFASGHLRSLSSRPGLGETFHFHCTDTNGEWVVRFDGPGIEVRAEHAKGDIAIRGGASDMLLFVWGRASATNLEILGDADLLTAWSELLPSE